MERKEGRRGERGEGRGSQEEWPLGKLLRPSSTTEGTPVHATLPSAVKDCTDNGTHRKGRASEQGHVTGQEPDGMESKPSTIG